MPVVRFKWITREIIRNNPDITFLFGDNLLKTGLAGQAKEARGEPNTIGVPTKKAPSMHPDSFFRDDEIEKNMLAINAAFSLIPSGATVGIPEAGLGTGLADLQNKAPKTYAYLLDKIHNIK